MEGLYLKAPNQLVLKKIKSDNFIGENDVKIKVIYGGICGSDVGVYEGKLPHAQYPIIPGHEVLGEIIEVGNRVSFKKGQRVVVHPNTYCETCEYCKNGKTNICPYKKSIGINKDGAFKEEIIVPSKYVFLVPEQLTNKRAILIEPLSVVVHALRNSKINEQVNIAVTGCGTEGLLTIALANHLGATVTAIDINNEKLLKLKNEYPNIVVQQPNEAHNNSFDIVVEASGAKESFERCVDLVKPGGTILIIGLTSIAEAPITKIVREEITIKGSIIYDAVNDFHKSINYLLDSDFSIDSVISGIVPVKNYNVAYNMAMSGKNRKIILDFTNNEEEEQWNKN